MRHYQSLGDSRDRLPRRSQSPGLDSHHDHDLDAPVFGPALHRDALNRPSQFLPGSLYAHPNRRHHAGGAMHDPRWDDGRERDCATLTFASWNQVGGWLRRLATLRQAGTVRAATCGSRWAPIKPVCYCDPRSRRVFNEQRDCIRSHLIRSSLSRTMLKCRSGWPLRSGHVSLRDVTALVSGSRS